MDDSFRIAVSAVLVTTRLQTFAQSGMVVDFAVENNPDGTVFVAQGLVPGGQVHNAEAPHANPHRTISVNSLVVRTAMDHGGTHLPERFTLNPRSLELHDPGDAAHMYALLLHRIAACLRIQNHDFLIEQTPGKRPLGNLIGAG